MLPLLIDQDFDHDILRGLRRRLPGLDALTALNCGLDQSNDPEIIAWAAEHRRLIATHDCNTMPRHAYDAVRTGEPMAGIFVVPQSMPVGMAITDIELIVTCTSADEWEDLVLFLPLRG